MNPQTSHSNDRPIAPWVVVGLLLAAGLPVLVGTGFLLRELLGPPAPSIEGGTRLVYSMDGPKGTIDRAVTVVRDRVKGRGIRGVRVFRVDSRTFAVEVPPEQWPAPSSMLLERDLNAEDASFRVVEPDPEDLDGLWDVRGFPVGGGTVQIGAERMNYRWRNGTEFIGLERGLDGSRPAQHAAGDAVVNDPINLVRRLVETTGILELLVVADQPSDFPEGTDEAKERARIREWLLAHPQRGVAEFNRLGPDGGGPPSSIRWIPQLDSGAVALRGSSAGTAVPVVVRDDGARFGKPNIVDVHPSTATYGDPMLVVRLRGGGLREWIEASAADGRTLAVVVGDQVVELVGFSEDLLNSIEVGGDVAPDGLSMDDVAALASILRNDDLPVSPELKHIERIAGEKDD
jgi:preprotein translocase subunit SecD